MVTEFEAHPWIRGGQAQTLAAFFWSGAPKLAPDEWMHVTMPDGDQIELAINHPPVPARANLYLMHGLGGDADSSYKLRIAKKLLPLGFRIIRHNHRGNGVHLKDTKGMYHSGSARDVLACVHDIARRWPDPPLGMVGFSLSGTIMLNLLGRHAKELEEIGIVKAALSICAPLDLEACSFALSQRRNKHIDLFFAKTTIEQLRKRRFVSEDYVKKHLRSPSLRKVDEYITAPYAGFLNADHYYQSCSPRSVIGQIKIETLILAAADDPIVPSESVLETGLSEHVSLRMEASGGHMGFLSRRLTPHGDYRWLDSFVESWASTYLLKD